VPKWPEVAASLSIGIELNYLESFKEDNKMYQQKEETMPYIFLAVKICIFL